MQNRPIIKTLNTVEDVQGVFGDGLPPEEVKRLAEKKERRNRKKYPFIPNTGFVKKYQPYTKKKKTYFFAEEVR